MTVQASTGTDHTGPTAATTAAMPDRGVGSRPRARAALFTRDEILLRGLVDLLAVEPSIALEPSARPSGRLVDLVEDTSIDLAILGIEGPGRTGVCLEGARTLKEARPDLMLVLIVDDLLDSEVLAAIHAGVDGIACRYSPARDLVDVLRRAARGEPALDRRFFSGMVRALRARGRSGGESLTARERQVVRLVAAGERNGSIASSLFISESTVKFHLRNVCAKLEAESRAELVAIALRLGLA